MEKHIRLKALRSVLVVALIVAGTGTAAKVADAGGAAPGTGADQGSHSLQKSGPKHAKLQHGVLRVKGTPASDEIALRLQAGNPAILQVDVDDDGSADFSFERKEIARIAVDARPGDDLVRIDDGNGAFTDSIPTTLDGDAGKDVLGGGAGAESLVGGDGDDVIDGNGGADTGLMGAGDDTFVWDPGDGSDVVEGQDGADTMVFNGAGGAENFDFSANGNRLRFFRTQGTITMDTAGVERVDLNALGGIDDTVVNDLSGTDVKSIVLDLAADGAVDTTTVNGTAGNDRISIAPNAGAVDVTGLAAALKIVGSEAANDLLNVNGLDGNDTISGAVGLAALIKVGIDGGAGDDTINGGDGAEVLLGGDGNDEIDGNGGADTGLMGDGVDTFVWDPGDGSDVVEGQEGADTMLFNGAGGAENFDLSANGNRLRFFRTQGAITMDLNDTEFIDVQALGGADTAVVNDTSGTDLKRIVFDLEAATGGGAGDGAADSVTVNGTNDPDDIQITASGSVVTVNGVFPTVQIDHSEAANDKLTLNGLGGDDNIVIDDDVAGLIQTLVDLGADE